MHIIIIEKFIFRRATSYLLLSQMHEHIPIYMCAHRRSQAYMHMQLCRHVLKRRAWTHTTIHAHPSKKSLTLRPHRVHVSPSGIINTMLMNIGLGPEACEERARYRERQTGREIKRTKGGRMKEDNGFSLNKCTAQGTYGGGEYWNWGKEGRALAGKTDYSNTVEVRIERE